MMSIWGDTKLFQHEETRENEEGVEPPYQQAAPCVDSRLHVNLCLDRTDKFPDMTDLATHSISGFTDLRPCKIRFRPALTMKRSLEPEDACSQIEAGRYRNVKKSGPPECLAFFPQRSAMRCRHGRCERSE